MNISAEFHTSPQPTLSNAFKTIFSFYIDLIFPRYCLSCACKINTSGSNILCTQCAESLKPISGAFCQLCGRPGGTAIAGRCSDCLRTKRSFDISRAAYIYTHPINLLIRRFKYNCLPQIGAYLSRLFAYSAERLPPEYHTADVIVPVPLHPLRWVARGFNQADILARPLAGRLNIPVSSENLYRTKYTPRQVGLTAGARIKNLQGAFKILNPRSFTGCNVILVDDVITTGATINACARTLKRAGAETVCALVLAAPLMNKIDEIEDSTTTASLDS